MLRSEKRIHCTAASNKAICVLALKYLEKVLGETADAYLANFVIVGHQSRLEILTDSNILSKIQIDLRVSRLLTSKACILDKVPEMIQFVNYCKVFRIKIML